MTKIFTITLLLIVLFSCENNVANSEVVVEDCSTVESYYNTSIAPIMSQKCNGCHSGNNPSAGLLTNNYIDVKGGIGGILNRVERDNNAPGFMPLGGQKLSTEQISFLQIFLEMDCE